MAPAALASGFHIFGVMLAVSTVFLRARALMAASRGSREALDRALFIDGVWGLSALIVIPTGLLRAFGSLEKGEQFYLHNGAFMMKMSVLVLLMLLELWPMIVFVVWRVKEKRSDWRVPHDVMTTSCARFGRMSYLQSALLVAMMFIAPFMARGALQFS